MSNDASCEESSVREGVGYDETFGLGDEFEDFSPSSERETSAQSSDDDVESYAEGCKEVEREDKVGKKGSGSDGDDDGDEEDDDGDKEPCEGTLVGPGDNCPFILPKEWAVNRFLPLMSDKVFEELRTQYQIPEHIPICLLRENERCYSGRTADVGMYDAMFAAGLRLLLMALHRQLVDFLGLSLARLLQMLE